MIFAHGARFCGHALYIKDGRLKYAYDYLGHGPQEVVSDVPVPAGRHVLGVEFDKQGQDATAAFGTVHLFIDAQPTGEPYVDLGKEAIGMMNGTNPNWRRWRWKKARRWPATWTRS